MHLKLCSMTGFRKIELMMRQACLAPRLLVPMFLMLLIRWNSHVILNNKNKKSNDLWYYKVSFIRNSMTIHSSHQSKLKQKLECIEGVKEIKLSAMETLFLLSPNIICYRSSYSELCIYVILILIFRENKVWYLTYK